MEKNAGPKKIIIYDDTLTVIETIMAVIMYTFVFVVIFFMLFIFYTNGLNEDTFAKTPNFIVGIFAFLAPAIHISEVNIVELDLVYNKIYSTQKIVFYKKINVIDASSFEYVAINKFGFEYTVTIWFQGNRHFRILSFYKKEKAFLYAKALCKQTNVDLLDKTTDKSKWIDNSDL